MASGSHEISFSDSSKNLKVAARRQKYYHDQTASETDYQIGKFVRRYYPPAVARKLELGWKGPYLIVDKVSDLTYTI